VRKKKKKAVEAEENYEQQQGINKEVNTDSTKTAKLSLKGSGSIERRDTLTLK
jgi:hypothetical protein